MWERHLSGHRLPSLVVVACMLAACGAGGATGAPSAPATTPVDSAAPGATGQGLIVALADGDGAAAAALEDEMLRVAASATQPAQIWAGLTAQYGSFERIGSVSTTVEASYALVTVDAYFADATVILNVSIDGAGLVAGMHVGAVIAAPPASGSPSPPPT